MTMGKHGKYIKHYRDDWEKIPIFKKKMVKFGKNKLKALSKRSKKQNAVTNSVAASNKILKKNHNAEKKVTFQKQVLLKETLTEGSPLVKSIKAEEIILNEISKPIKKKVVPAQEEEKKPKPKPVERKKKRQQTLTSDTRLLLKLMNKK